MHKIKPLFFILVLIASTACVYTSNTKKTKSMGVYSEDLTAYLPKDAEDSSTVSIAESEQAEIDSSLVITARLDSVLRLVNAYNKEKKSYIEGLTIQLYSGPNREEAQEAQMKAFRYFPESKPKIIFDQPNYKVRMEKFYSQLEAYPVFKEVQSKFPRAILVPARIDVTKK